jgi:tetratricopeptide (TPR) repeat protein
MEQFAQRIAVEYALEPLAEEETIAYIAHRVHIAGGRRPLFSRLACLKVFALTGGVPRLINQLCDHALVYGYAAQAETITAQVVLDAARVRDKNGFLPFREDPDAIEPSPSELEAETEEVAAQISARSEPNRPSSNTNPVSSPDPAALYRKALSLKQAGEFSQALALLDRLTDDGVWGIKALGQKGLCLKAIGRYEDALAVFRTALDRPSGSTQDQVSLRYLYARTLESMGRSQEAVECYRTISRDGRQYRDVAVRLDQLAPSTPFDADAMVSPPTWLQSLVRSCSQLLRSTS